MNIARQFQPKPKSDKRDRPVSETATRQRPVVKKRTPAQGKRLSKKRK